MRLFVHHRTEYSFSEPQRRVVQRARIVPSSFVGQNIIDWQIDVGCDVRLRSARDGYGNETTMLYVDGPVERISITVSGEVLTENRAGMVEGAPEPLPPMVFLRATHLTNADKAIIDFAEGVAADAQGPLDTAHRLMRALHEKVRFDATGMDVDRTAADAFANGHGVCQDHAHIFVAAARALDIPARYVSGHLYRRDGGSAQTAAHAWAEAHIPDYGWIGFDPANDLCPDEAYIRVAVGLDYREAAPLVGARIGGGIEVLDVGVSVSDTQSQLQTQS